MKARTRTKDVNACTLRFDPDGFMRSTVQNGKRRSAMKHSDYLKNCSCEMSPVAKTGVFWPKSLDFGTLCRRHSQPSLRAPALFDRSSNGCGAMRYRATSLRLLTKPARKVKSTPVWASRSRQRPQLSNKEFAIDRRAKILSHPIHQIL